MFFPLKKEQIKALHYQEDRVHSGKSSPEYYIFNLITVFSLCLIFATQSQELSKSAQD